MTSKIYFIYICLVLFSFIGLAPTAAFASDTTKAPIILILDGSGSMWGQIDGKTKIAIARKVVKNLVGDMAQDQPIGLVAYGHRQKKDCEDIEELIPPGINNHGEINSALPSYKSSGPYSIGQYRS